MKKKKQPLTEKQLEAKRLYEKIIFVPLTEHESKPYFLKYEPTETTAEIHLCDINGRRFIKVADLGVYYPNAIIQKVIEEGFIPKTDLIHTRANKPVFAIIAVDVVESAFDKIAKHFRWDDTYEKNMLHAIIEGAKEATNVGKFQISEEDLVASEEAFNERMRLITENTREKREQVRQEAIQDKQPADEPSQQKDEPQEEEKLDGLKLAEILLSVIVKNKQFRDKIQNYEKQLEIYKKLVSNYEKQLEIYKEMVSNYDKTIANYDIKVNNLEAQVASLEEQFVASKQTTD